MLGRNNLICKKGQAFRKIIGKSPDGDKFEQANGKGRKLFFVKGLRPLKLHLHSHAAVVVEHALALKAAGIHVAGIDLIVTGEGTELFQGGHQGVPVAAGEVCSAAASAEQGIPGKKGVFTADGDAAAGMPGGGDDVETEPGLFHHVSVVIVFAALRQPVPKVLGNTGAYIVSAVHVNRGPGLLGGRPPARRCGHSDHG